MIRLYDAFQRCDIEKLIEEYAKILPSADKNFEPYSEEDKLAISRKEIAEAYKRMDAIGETLQPVQDADIALVSLYYSFDEKDRAYYDATCIEAKEYQSWVKNGCPMDATPECFSFIMCTWEEILNYSVPESISNWLGEEKFLAGMLYEMCFFGVDPKGLEKEKRKIDESVAEVEEAIKNGDESRFTDVDEMMKELSEECGFEYNPPTEEERAEWRKEFEWETAKNREAANNMFAALAKESES